MLLQNPSDFCLQVATMGLSDNKAFAITKVFFGRKVSKTKLVNVRYINSFR